MGRTVPTLNQAIDATIRDLSVIRDGLTTPDRKVWDEFIRTSHLNERAISLAVFYDPFDAMILAMLFKQFKMIKKLGGDTSEWNEWNDTTLDSSTDQSPQGSKSA